MWDCSSKLNFLTCDFHKLLIFASQRLILNYISKEDLEKVFNFDEYDPDELVKTLKKSTCEKKFNKSFDKLSHTEKIYAIYFFLGSILDPEKPAPKLTAWNEAAISAIFKQLQDDICEHKMENARQILSNTLHQIKEHNNTDVIQISKDCTSNVSWSNAIDFLKYSILYDNDYDLSPEQITDSDYNASLSVNLGKRKVAEMLIEIMGLAKQFNVYD